jgi:hypothetical protein
VGFVLQDKALLLHKERLAGSVPQLEQSLTDETRRRVALEDELRGAGGTVPGR